MVKFFFSVCFLVCFTGLNGFCQDNKAIVSKDTVAKTEKVSYHLQITLVGQHQLPFNSPYVGTLSLVPDEKLRMSVTSTMFLGTRLWKGGEVFLNPELSGGRGLSATSGIAAFPNGEVYRVGNPEPVLTIGRCFLRQTFALSTDKVNVDGAQNQLQGLVPASRLTFTFGKFSVADMFDNNSYSHDPRNQFLNWAMMSAGAWDYPANTRGYTYGFVAELIKPSWALRFASTMVPEVANGPYLDLDITHAHSETLQFDKHINIHKRGGVVRFLVYNTFAHMGNYYQAIANNPTAPDVTLTREYGRTKYGFVVNAEQEVNDIIGLFGRLSWNDGQNETWAFTEIDRSANVGMVVKGSAWKRPNDNFGVAILADGLSNPHREYLADGGYGFIIGDGKLNYGLESIAELYYNCKFLSNFWLTPDYQFVVNPAYNKDRGPVNIIGIRGHMEF
jgi:high affinity Mn2+ porin